MNATTPIQSISQAYLANPNIKGMPYEEGIHAIHDTSKGLAAFVDSYRKLTQLQMPIMKDTNLHFSARLSPPSTPPFTGILISLTASPSWQTRVSCARYSST